VVFKWIGRRIKKTHKAIKDKFISDSTMLRDLVLDVLESSPDVSAAAYSYSVVIPMVEEIYGSSAMSAQMNMILGGVKDPKVAQKVRMLFSSYERGIALKKLGQVV